MISYEKLGYPVLSGVFSSLATLVGESYFKLPTYSLENLFWFSFGILMFVLLNQIQYKFLFNSFQLNGATLTTLLVFITQNITIAMSRPTQLTYKWWVGVFLISYGVYLLKRDHDIQNKHKTI